MKRCACISIMCLAAFLATKPTSARAFCFDEAGKAFDISPQILKSIAKAESEFNPEALRLNTDGSFDVGLMQVNSIWRKSKGEAFWDRALESPCGNVYAGAEILSECMGKYGYTWKAIGCYHSKRPTRSSRYAWRVLAAMVRLQEQEREQQTRVSSNE